MKKKLIGAISLGIVGALCGGLACAYAIAASAENDVPVLPEKAYLGETIEVPQKTVEKNGKKVKASVLITAPDGGQFTGNVLLAEEIGLYTVEYYAYIDGEQVSLPTENITIVRKASDVFETNDYATVENATFIHNEELKGVRASLSNGGTVTLSKIFDVSDFTQDDVLIELIAEGSKEGAVDYTNLTITLTDVEDESNMLSVYMTDSGNNCSSGMSPWGQGTYIRVGATDQLPAGYENGKLLTLPQFGTPIWHTFKKQTEDYPYRTAKLYFDYEEKAMYASDSYFSSAPVQTLIADLDNPADFSNVWGGFESGKVRISISAAGLSAATANVLITQIAGYDLSQEDFEDTTAPTLTIDYAEETFVPVSVMGSDYRVFDAIVNDDLDNEVDLEISAYYQSAVASEKADVAIENGYIRTDYAGIYTLHYKAMDRSGNVSEQYVAIPCSVSGKDITIETTDEDQTVQTYDKVTIGGVESITASGGSGALKLSCEVFDPDGELVKIVKNAFVADKTGEYKAVYRATDYLGISAKTEVSVLAKAPQKPIFTEELYLPDILIKDFEYALPEYPAKEAINGEMTDVAVTVYANGEEVKNGEFIASGEKVLLKFVANGTTGTTEHSVEIPVTDGNDGKDQEKYFYGENLDEVVNEKDHLTVRFDTAAKMSFANVLHTNKFSLGFTFGENEKNFSVMKIKLTDAKDKNLSVTITLTEENGTIYLTTPHSAVRGEFSASQGAYELVYKNATKNLTDKNANTCGAVSYDDNGDPFTGFSDTVYMTVLFEEVSSASAVRFTLLNNQTLGYRTSRYESRRDRIAPEIYLQESYAVKNTLGETARISAGNAYDVLGYVKTFTVTVYDPQGNKVLDNVSAREFYEVELTQYGDYRVEYTAADNHGVKYTQTKLISVVEQEAPTLKVAQIKKEYAVGDEISIPEYRLTDNSGAYSLDVILIMPDNDMRLLIHDENGTVFSKLTVDDTAYEAAFKVNEKTFRLQKAGKYTLRFFAYDENFNYVTVEYEFTVKE